MYYDYKIFNIYQNWYPRCKSDEIIVSIRDQQGICRTNMFMGFEETVMYIMTCIDHIHYVHDLSCHVQSIKIELV